MMGHRQVEQASLFYEFSLERHVPPDHLLRSIWPAPGSKDTKFGVTIGPEVGHREAEVYTRVLV